MSETLPQIEETLVSLFRRRLQSRTALTAETDLLQSGLLDSLSVLDLVHSIEKHFGVAIENADISPRNFRSLRALASLVASRRAALDRRAA